MKKFVAVLLVLTMVLATCSVAFAYKVKKAGKYVEFKKSAWGYEKVTNNHGKNKTVALKKGSIAYVDRVKGDWYRIKIPTKTAGVYDHYWFNKKYTKSTKVKGIYYVFSSGGSDRSRFNGDEPSYAREIRGLTVKTSGKVNMRSTPSLKGKSQGVIPKGKKVTLTGKAGMDSCGVIFFQVKYKGKTNYIASEYIRESDIKKIVALAPEEFWDDIFLSALGA